MNYNNSLYSKMYHIIIVRIVTRTIKIVKTIACIIIRVKVIKHELF